MGSFEKDTKQKKKRGKNSDKKPKENPKQIELKTLNKMNHYVIDDESDEEEDTSKNNLGKEVDTPGSKAGGNRPAREIVFD